VKLKRLEKNALFLYKGVGQNIQEERRSAIKMVSKISEALEIINEIRKKPVHLARPFSQYPLIKTG